MTFRQVIGFVATIASKRVDANAAAQGGGQEEEDDADSHAGTGEPVTALFANLKGFGRALEKAVLRPGSGVPWDLIRGQLICTSGAAIVEALGALKESTSTAMGQRRITVRSPLNEDLEI